MRHLPTTTFALIRWSSSPRSIETATGAWLKVKRSKITVKARPATSLQPHHRVESCRLQRSVLRAERALIFLVERGRHLFRDFGRGVGYRQRARPVLELARARLARPARNQLRPRKRADEISEDLVLLALDVACLSCTRASFTTSSRLMNANAPVSSAVV